MKADRLVSILLLLQSAPRRTAQELARAMEVSARTIYRDIDALCAAGIPIHAERGYAGGIVLAEGYRHALVHLGEDEIRALFVSGGSILADLGLGANLDRALEKLRGGLSDGQQRVARHTGERIHIDQRRWHQDDAPVELLARLRRAIWDDRRIDMRYEDRSGTASLRVVDPLGLVSKAGVWYVVANTDEGYRSFRVDRVRELHERDECFTRPAGFDLDAYWRQSSTYRGPWVDSFAFDLRVARHALAEVTSYWRFELLDEADVPLVRLHVPSLEVAAHQVLSWGSAVEAIEPPALRTAIAEHARALLDRYGALATI